MKPVFPVACITLFTSLSGCAQDYSLAPPVDSEQMTITVKVPEELEAKPLQALYRSVSCKRVIRDDRGRRVVRDGHHEIKAQLKLQRQGQSDLYQTTLPVNGGGACKWHLANVTFGVAYSYPTRFGENVTYGAGGGVVVMFDQDNSPSGGADIKVEGDLTIKKDYYPWVSEAFTGGYHKRASLAGEGPISLKYQAPQARKVYFEPVLHSGLTVYSVQPNEKTQGNHTRFIYPDGSIVADGRSEPNFRKLEVIRKAAQVNQ